MNENNMTQYIPKSDLVAEIEKRWRSLANKNYKANGKYDIEISTLLSIKSFINTLEVKEFKVEPKFKIEKDKYYVCIRDLFDQYDDKVFIKDEIYLSTKDGYLIPSNSNVPHQVFCPDTYFEPWVIQDARDGDVLCIHSSESGFDCVFLYKNTVEIESGRNVAVAYCGIDVYADRIDFGIQGPDCIDVGKIKPATEEQSDLLFQKMKESGYEWDEVNKVLKEIEPKSPWSEEDEQNLNVCLGYIPDESLKRWLTDIIHIKYLNKSIPEVNPAWSDGDEVANEYIDLGLPSGTFWKLINEKGYYTFDNAVEKFGDLLPTKEQWEELRDYCIWVWSNNGYVVTGPNNNTIFLPADGAHVETGVYGVGTDGHYWSCTNDKKGYAWDMYFDRDDLNVFLGFHYYGRSVRLVK